MCFEQNPLLLQDGVQNLDRIQSCLTISNCGQSPYLQTLLKVRKTQCVRCCVQIWFSVNDLIQEINQYITIDNPPICCRQWVHFASLIVSMVFNLCAFIHVLFVLHYFIGNRASTDWYSAEQSQELFVRPKLIEKFLWRAQLDADTGLVKLHFYN